MLETISRGLSSSIYQLHINCDKYGTGYDIEVHGNKVTLCLMSGNASENNIIERIDACSDKEGIAFAEEVVSKLEKKVLEMC